MSPFDIIKNINSGNETEDLSEYIPFIINKNFSLFPDTLFYAQMMNLNYNLSAKHQYLYMINSIRPRKRFEKWPKKQKDLDYEAVRTHFSLSDKKTREALSVLTREQLDYIIKKEKQKDE